MKPHIKRMYGIWHCYGFIGIGIEQIGVYGLGYTASGAYCDWRRFCEGQQA